MKDLFRCHYCGEQFLGEEMNCIMDSNKPDDAPGLMLCDGCMDGALGVAMKNIAERNAVQ